MTKLDKIRDEMADKITEDAGDLFRYGFDVSTTHWQKIVEPLENQLEILINFLKITDEKWWFDHKDSKSKSLACACVFCDMGDSGRKKNPDGHDMDCHISNGHYLIEYAKQALANYRKEME